MMAKFSGLNPKRLYVSLEKEKQNFCVVLTNSIKRACEISCRSRAATAKNCTKKRDARAKMFFCQSLPFVFLLFVIAVAKTPYCCHPEMLLPW